MKFLLTLIVALSPSLLWGQIQLCSPQKIAALRASLPTTENGRWEELFDDPTTLYYTDTEIPPAYQHADKGLLVGGSFIGSNPNTSFHSPRYNISGDANEASKGHGRGGNGNIEFPWRNPGGTDSGEGTVKTFKLMWLPKKDNGKPWPVVWYPDVLTGARTGHHYGYAWIFPVGTIFGECLCLKDREGILHTFEVRLRIRETTYWNVEILRPFPSSKDLAERLGQIDDAKFGTFVTYLKGDETIPERRLVDQLHPTRIGFDAKAGVATIPNFSEQMVKELLDNTPFKSAVGAEWKRGTNGVVAHSPTSQSDFNIVPKNYHGTFIGTDSDSCMKCHESTLMHVDRFDNRRDWYGYVRGSADGIFSFHPVDPRTISYNGFPTNVVFRKSFIDSGMVARYNLSEHPSDRYTLIKR